MSTPHPPPPSKRGQIYDSPIWPAWKQHPLLTAAGWLSVVASLWCGFWLIVHYLLHLL